jgi:hypothetical protein
MDGSIFNGIANFMIVGLIAIILLLCMGLYEGWKAFQNPKIKSKVLLIPTVKYSIHKNKLDSVYVYTGK